MPMNVIFKQQEAKTKRNPERSHRNKHLTYRGTKITL